MSEASVFDMVQLKPETSIDGKIIVEDGFVHFLAMKLKAWIQDEIVLLVPNTFDSEWMETKKTTCSGTSHKGVNKRRCPGLNLSVE